MATRRNVNECRGIRLVKIQWATTGARGVSFKDKLITHFTPCPLANTHTRDPHWSDLLIPPSPATQHPTIVAHALHGLFFARENVQAPSLQASFRFWLINGSFVIALASWGGQTSLFATPGLARTAHGPGLAHWGCGRACHTMKKLEKKHGM